MSETVRLGASRSAASSGQFDVRWAHGCGDDPRPSPVMAPTGDEPTRRAIQEWQPSKLDGEEVASMSLWLGRGGFGLAFAQDGGAPAVEPRVAPSNPVDHDGHPVPGG